MATMLTINLARIGLMQAIVLVLVLFVSDVQGQAQVFAQVGSTVSVTIQLRDQNTNIISPTGQTMIEVGFFGAPTVTTQYRDRVNVDNYSGGFGNPTITFTFGQLQLADGGNFQCTSTFGGNIQCGPTLVVLGRPTLPQLTVSPSPVIAGSDAELTCTATSTSNPKIPQLVLVYVLKQNGNIITQPRTSSFLIKGIGPGSNGDRIQCLAYELNTVSNQLTGLESGDSEPYTLDPNYGPLVIAPNPNITSYSLKRGDRLNDIECQAACNPPCDFLWYKAPNQQDIVAQGSILSLGAVTSDEEGTYVCQAGNSVSNKLLPVKVEVEESLGGITFEPPRDNYQVREGSEIPAILCNADCVPACKFEWLRNGIFLYESRGINFGQVGRADSGTYTCRASNDRGSNEKAIVVDVQYPPSAPELSPGGLRYELEENAAVIPDINCISDCNPQCEVLWFREGANTALSRNNLVLGTATREDTGSYECLARNDLGQEITQPVTVQILYRPEDITFTPPDVSYNIEEGANLVPITCQADCNPACQFAWFKDNDFSQAAVESETLDFGLADLTDSGQWTCRASNPYGQQQKQLNVNIAYGPAEAILTPPRSTYTLALNTDSMPDVVCAADCNPPCSISWFKNNDPFPSTSNTTVSLGKVELNDQGNFTCRASNRLGSATKSFRLVVTYGPASSIELIPSQTRYNINKGTPLSVTCSATCDPACSFTWVKADTNEQYSSNGNLSIPAVQTEDSGVFECVANNGVGTAARARITVNVLMGPTNVVIKPRGPLSLKEGTDFVLTCSGTCSPECAYTWRRGSQDVPSQEGALTLSDVSKDSAGTYTCEARNSVDFQTATIDVAVQYGAGDSITINPDVPKVEVQEGRSLELSCSAVCNPECSLRWLKGTNDFSTGPVLSIPNINRAQQDVYTCLADNSVRNPAFKSVPVDVVYGPGDAPDIFPDVDVQTVDRGDSFQARCYADCNPPCSIQWFFGNTQQDSQDGVLRLTNLDTANQGEYTCLASNRVARGQRKLLLQVQAGPGATIRFQPPETPVMITEGRSQRITCSAQCSPPCTLYWQFGSQNVSDTGILDLNEISRDEAGIYSCYATNDVNSLSSKQLEVEVLYGPEGSTRIIPDGTKNLDVGDTLNLFCVADCFPPCEYTWYLGQNQIPSSEGELRIDSVGLRNSGTYSCEASNDVGKREAKKLDVFVESGPTGSITFRPPGNTTTLIEGNTLQVSCSAECSPPCSYSWSRGAQQVPSVNGVLTLPGIQKEQRGDYTCVAANGEGRQTSKVLTVNVDYGPHDSVKLDPSGAVQTLNEGASFKISCQSDCNPPCEHTWYFVNTPLNTTNNELRLVSVTKTNEGNYKCVASNGIGPSAERNVFISVQTGPRNKVIIDPPVAILQVNEGTPFELTCSAECDPECTFTWFFGADRVPGKDGLLSRPIASRDDSGPYRCYAENYVSVQGSRQIQVDVNYGPTSGVTLDPAGDQEISEGDTLTLRCNAECKPDCQFTWLKGSTIVPSTSGRLTVGPATAQTTGTYTCQADNAVTTAVSEPISITVLKPPGDSIRFFPPNENPSVLEGSDITITCTADCIPDCKYVWRDGLTDIPGSEDGTLRLQNIQRQASPLYSCSAFNGVGVTASKRLVLDVQYGPHSTVTLFPPQATSTIGGSVSIACSADCNPPCNRQWSKGSNLIPSKQGILTLNSLTTQDGGNYTCAASNNVGLALGTAEVNVVSGGQVRVEFIPSNTSPTVQEGGQFTVTCVASCSPVCQFEWTKDGVTVSRSPSLEIPKVSKTSQGVYTCRAQNSAGADVAQSLSLRVTYGPDNSIRLVPPVYYRELRSGESLLSRCEADCSPSCDVSWVKDGLPVNGAKDGNLYIPSIGVDDGGVYTCFADNGVGPKADVDLVIAVTFGPVEGSIKFVPPTRVRSVQEGDNFTVTCEAECLPSCAFTWYVGNYKYETDDGVLFIQTTDRRDAGIYTCHADNGVGRTQMLDLQLYVEYGPSMINMVPPRPSYQVSEGTEIPPISCSADCSPVCETIWFQGNTRIWDGEVLALGQITRQDQGVYTCVVGNGYGQMEASFEVLINSFPRIELFIVNEKKFKATVKENLPVTLYCRVDAIPVGDIMLYNGSKPLFSKKKVPEISYAWQRSTCFDSGTYECRADNGIADGASEIIELEVLCSPRFDPRVFKQPYVAGQIGGTAVITVPVVADPTPSFLWYKKKGGNNEIITMNDDGEESELFFYSNDTSSTLVIKNVQEEDFGDYVVNIANQEGTDNITFSLVAEGPPYKPQQLHTHPVSDDTVELSWKPGFNGGHDQQFIIEFQRQYTGEWRSINKTIADREGEVKTNVTDLRPNTSYIFRIRGKNRFGFSNYSEESEGITEESTDPAPRKAGDVSTTPVLLGVGIALGFLVGAGITAIVVVTRCRPKPTKHGENTIEDYKSDTTYDTLYLKDALWAQRHIKLRSNDSFGSTRSPYNGFDYRQPEDTTIRYTDNYSKGLKPGEYMLSNL